MVTNIVIFQLQTTRLTAEQLVQQLLDQGIRLLALANNRLRAIVHQGISRNDICSVSDAIQSILTQSARTAVG
ncbi:MAG: hypothetical protein AB2989_05995 [Candidatus Symbiodolus clandestinus]